MSAADSQPREQLLRLIGDNRENCLRQCREDARSESLHAAALTGEALDEVCGGLLAAVEASLSDDGGPTGESHVDRVFRRGGWSIPHSELMRCLDGLRRSLRGLLLEDCRLDPGLLAGLDRLDESIEEIKRDSLNRFLVDQERRFRLVFEKSAVCEVFVDSRGRLLVGNPAFRESFGYDDAQLADGLGGLFTSSDDFDAFVEMLSPEKDVEDRGFEARLAARDGSVGWYRIDAAEAGGFGGEVGVWLVMFQDVTLHKEAARKIRRQRDLLTTAEGLAGIGAWEWNLVEDTWWFSRNWQVIHGTSRNGLRTGELLELAHPDDAGEISWAFQAARTEGVAYDLEHRVVRENDGEVRHLKVRGEMEYDEDGRPSRMVGVSQDLTEHREAERRLGYNLALLQAQMEASPDGVVLSAPDSRLLSWNRRFMDIWGLSGEVMDTADGNRALEAVRRELADPDGFIAEVKRLMGAPDENETGREIQLTGGRVLERHSRAVRDPDGTYWGRVWFYRDISERMRAEKALRRSNRALKVLRDSSDALLRAGEEDTLLGDVCRIVVETGGYSMAWVGFAMDDPARTVRPVAHWGMRDDYVENIRLTWDESATGQGPGGRAIRLRKPQMARDIATDPFFKPWRQSALDRGFASCLSLPLCSEDSCLGVLNIYAYETDAFDSEEVELLRHLAGQLAHGLVTLRRGREHEQAVEALRTSEERFRRLAENARDMIFRMSLPDGKYEYVSPACEAVMGYPPEDFYANPAFIGGILAPDFGEYFRRKWKDLMRGEVEPVSEYRIITPDGAQKWLSQRNVLVRDADGNPVALEGIVTDIDESKRSAEELRHRSFELEILNQLSGKLGYTLDYGELLRLLMNNLHQVMNYDVVAGALVREDGLDVSIQCAVPASDDIKEYVAGRLARTVERFTGGAAGEAAPSARVVDCAAMKGMGSLDALRSSFQVPLFTRNREVAGVILVGSGTVNAFNLGQVRMLYALAGQASESVERLRELMAEERKGLSQFLGALPEGVFLLDKHLHVEVSNGNAQHILRRVTGRAGRFETILDTPLMRVVGEGMDHGGRVELRAVDEQAVYEVWSTPLRHGPYAGGWMLLLRDVTVDSLAEEALRSSEEKFRSLFDSSGDAIFVHDLEGRFLDVNRRACERLGYTRRELLRMSPADIDSPGFADRVGERIKQIREKEYTFFETEHVRSDGTTVPTEITAKIIEYQGRPAILATARNITERKRAEEAVREREQLLKSLIQGIRAAFFIVDRRDLEVVEANQMGLDLLGRGREEVVGRSCREALAFQDLDYGDGKSLGGRRIISQEHVLRRPDGRLVPVSLSVLEVTIKAHPYYVFVCFDISQRKDLERQLAISQRLESVGQLAAGIAHEINTPVQFIANNLDFLKESCEYYTSYIRACERAREAVERGGDAAGAVRDELAPGLRDRLDFYMEESREALEESVQGVERISSIIGSMKHFSHPGGKRREKVDLNEAVESTVNVCRNEWKYDSELVTDLEEGLPVIEGYPADLNQAILNLVVNAAHAVTERYGGSGEKGRITVRTYAEGASAVLEVKDTGTGIAEEDQPRIFDPFFTTKEVGKGTGQGLAITHAVVVEKHGGEIDFNSAPGKGTTFFIRLPLEPPGEERNGN